MAKAPAFQFYVRDWLSDPQLRQASPSTRGIWIDCLCFMWEAPERGVLSGTEDALMRLLGINRAEWDLFCEEMDVTRFASRVTERNKKVTITNRRMKREAEAKKTNAERQDRYRKRRRDAKCDAGCDAKVTPPSSSSSSSSPSKMVPTLPSPPPPTPPTVEQELVATAGGDPPAQKRCSAEKLVDLYHKVLPGHPAVRELGETLRKRLRAAWKRHPDLQWWEEYFLYVSKSDFLCGRKKEFTADLFWLAGPQNQEKVVNGRYHVGMHSGGGKVSSTTARSLANLEAYRRQKDGEEEA